MRWNPSIVFIRLATRPLFLSFLPRQLKCGLLKTRLLLPTSELVPRQWACGLCHVYVGTRRYCSPAVTCASLLQCCLERMWPLVESSDVLLLWGRSLVSCLIFCFRYSGIDITMGERNLAVVLWECVAYYHPNSSSFPQPQTVRSLSYKQTVCVSLCLVCVVLLPGETD